jgi:spore germination protein KA
MKRVKKSRDNFEKKQMAEPSNNDICFSLSDNENTIRNAFGNSADLVVHRAKTDEPIPTEILLAYIDGLVGDNMVRESILKPLALLKVTAPGSSDDSPQDLFQQLKQRLLTNGELKEIKKTEDLLLGISSGCCAVLINGVPRAIIADVRGWKQRNIELPTTEPTIRGAKESFTETMRTNTSIIRRRIMDPRLWIEEYHIGEITHTTVSLIYLKGVADENTITELRSRITRIVTDTLQSSGHLEEFIEDAPFSPFPTLLRTERPDRVTGALLEGRLAIITDGTPFVLIAPCTLTMFLTSPDDYDERYFIGSFLRILRTALFLAALALTSLYVTVVTFHPELIPTSLALAIAAQREAVPFPALAEAIILELAFEILREATVRVPIAFGPTVSILGVLFLGQVAVQASLVSPLMVIIVAISSIASLGVPVYSMSVSTRLLRFPLLIISGCFGFIGLAWGLSAVLLHLMTLRSLGVPYLEPIAPLVVSDLKDSLIRLPWWALRTRPEFVGQQETVMEPSGLKPGPPPPRTGGKRSEKGAHRP